MACYNDCIKLSERIIEHHKTPPHHRKGHDMRKSITYGYCRVSTMKQSIQRQIDNIKKAYPGAVIISESYTGTKIDRPAFSKMLQQIQPGDVVVFDEVSRMSRNAAEGFALYRELYEKGVRLVFLKEPHLSTDVFRDRTQRRIDALTESTGSAATDKFIQSMIDALNTYSMDIVQEQIQLAFSQAQAEVDYLHARTAEGVRKAQAAGKQIGRKAGSTAGEGFKEYAKAKHAKDIIRKHCKDFGGTLSDADTMKLAGCARNSFYRYKKQIKQEMGA